jgi:hypothetical protein
MYPIRRTFVYSAGSQHPSGEPIVEQGRFYEAVFLPETPKQAHNPLVIQKGS